MRQVSRVLESQALSRLVNRANNPSLFADLLEVEILVVVREIDYCVHRRHELYPLRKPLESYLMGERFYCREAREQTRANNILAVKASYWIGL